MKTTKELYYEHLKLLDSCDAAKAFPKIYAMIKLGNLVKDFSIFTDLQSGKKSDDPHDPAAKNPPPEPDTDGHYYHTIRDITWTTFLHHFPSATSARFYDMTDEDRAICVDYYIKTGNVTNDQIVNTFLSYCVWASGNCNSEKIYYNQWYGVNLSQETVDAATLLERLVDIRLYTISQIPNYNLYGLGWTRGIILMWKLLSQYIKNN